MEVKQGYKQTEVGVIPEDWTVMPFIRAVSTYIDYRGRTPRKLGMSWGGGDILALSANNVQMGKIDPDKEAYFGSEELYKKWMVHGECEKGDVLLTMEAPLGNVAQIPDSQKYILSQRVLLIKPKGWLLRGFLAHYMKGSFFQNQLSLNATGTTAKGIQRRKLDDIAVYFPPTKAEQDAIAEVLSKADALIECYERLIAKKRLLKRGVMQELLTGRRRLRGFADATTGYKQTEVGVIPEDWDVTPIGALVTDFRGGAPLKPSDFTQTGVKVLPKGGVGRTGWLKIEDRDLQYCSSDYAASHPRNQVDESFTVVVLRDLVPSGPSIGLMVQIRDRETFVLAQGVYGFKVKEDVAVPGYLVQLSNTKWYRKLANSIMVGSTQVHITNSAFKSAQIPLPPVAEQKVIAEVLSAMDAEIALLEAQLAKYRQIKQGLMQNLLTGRIRLV